MTNFFVKKKAEIESIWEHLLSEKWVFIIKIEKFERKNHKKCITAKSFDHNGRLWVGGGDKAVF